MFCSSVHHRLRRTAHDGSKGALTPKSAAWLWNSGLWLIISKSKGFPNTTSRWRSLFISLFHMGCVQWHFRALSRRTAAWCCERCESEAKQSNYDIKVLKSWGAADSAANQRIEQLESSIRQEWDDIPLRPSSWSPQFQMLKDEGMLHSGKRGSVTTFLRHAAAIKFKMSWYYSWNNKMSPFQHFMF